MTRAMRLFVLALLVAPVLTFFVYRLARGLGFLDPPRDRQQEYRRTILTALFAFVLFLPILLFGFANDWPRIWRIFGVVNALALAFFALIGGLAALRLWRLRHPAEDAAAPETDEAAGKPLP
jgi:carbon starvation protein CstA